MVVSVVGKKLEYLLFLEVFDCRPGLFREKQQYRFIFPLALCPCPLYFIRSFLKATLKSYY